MSWRDSLTTIITILTQKNRYQAHHMFQKLSRASLTSHKSKWSWCYDYLFLNKDAKAQKDYVTCSRLHRGEMDRRGPAEHVLLPENMLFLCCQADSCTEEGMSWKSRVRREWNHQSVWWQGTMGQAMRLRGCWAPVVVRFGCSHYFHSVIPM